MLDIMQRVYPVLLAGGTGTRLWPVSRELYPKQLVKFIGDDSLVQSTIKRLRPVLDSKNVRIVCGKEHFHEIARHMAEIGLAPEGRVICEPCGRNTAPAILLAVLEIMKTEKESVLCIFPADHVIKHHERFYEKLESAIRLADQGYIVTFGINPHYPETGYGYIEGAAEISHGGRIVKRFVEKPDRETAKKYIQAGNFFWNSGMFAFKAAAIIQEFEIYQPDLLAQMTSLMRNGQVPTKTTYGQLPDISIDYAIMERTDKAVVLPSDFGWSDIGSWKSLYDFLDKDQNNNVIDGDVISIDTRNCFIMGHKRLIATNRLNHLVVVETPDSVFVSDLETSRDVKSIVERLKQSGRKEFHEHKTVYHPWGSFKTLEQKENFTVDRINVYPGAMVSLDVDAQGLTQLVVAKGKGEITAGNQSGMLTPGESVPICETDRVVLRNPGKDPLVIIRVAM